MSTQQNPASDATTQNYDADELKEAIAAGEAETPEVNVEADYQAAQRYSQGSVSQEEAEKMVAPELDIPQAQDVAIASDSSLTDATGNPDEYRDMARDVHHDSGAPGQVTDELVEKALEMGQPEDR